MKTILVILLLVSSSVFAQGYYPNQQYDNSLRMDEQRQLQQEFLDEQYRNQRQLMEEQRFNMEIDRRAAERKRDRSTFPGW